MPDESYIVPKGHGRLCGLVPRLRSSLEKSKIMKRIALCCFGAVLLGAAGNVQAADIDVEAFRLRQMAESLDIQGQACVDEAVKDAAVIQHTIAGTASFAKRACIVAIQAMLQAYYIPKGPQWDVLADKWMYPAVKNALASFNQGLTDGWPDDLPEGVKLNDFVVDAAGGAKSAESPANFCAPLTAPAKIPGHDVACISSAPPR